MHKRLTSLTGIVFIVALLGIVHVYSPVARSLSSHGHHAQHAADSTCQAVCQATADRRKAEPAPVQKQDDTPTLKVGFVPVIAIELMGIGLLRDGELWRQSSWMPPDIPLLSGYYSAGL